MRSGSRAGKALVTGASGGIGLPWHGSWRRAV